MRTSEHEWNESECMSVWTSEWERYMSSISFGVVDLCCVSRSSVCLFKRRFIFVCDCVCVCECLAKSVLDGVRCCMTPNGFGPTTWSHHRICTFITIIRVEIMLIFLLLLVFIGVRFFRSAYYRCICFCCSFSLLSRSPLYGWRWILLLLSFWFFYGLACSHKLHSDDDRM